MQFHPLSWRAVQGRFDAGAIPSTAVAWLGREAEKPTDIFALESLERRSFWRTKFPPED